jgi:hypothetical protein
VLNRVNRARKATGSTSDVEVKSEEADEHLTKSDERRLDEQQGKQQLEDKLRSNKSRQI